MIEATRYARNGDVHLAYQVVGEGNRDVLFLSGGTMPMDALGEHAKGLTMLRGLESLGRLIRTDPRGIGQSDTADDHFTPEIEADDIAAVLDAAEATDCLLVACFDACLGALAYAARRPSRLTGLIIVNGFVNFRDAQRDLKHFPPGGLRMFHELLDGGTAEMDIVAVTAPSERADERWRDWFDAAGRRGASPRTAERRWTAHEAADMHDCLPMVAVPTLIVHRENNLVVSARQAHLMAEEIPNARLVLLPGYDNIAYAGDVIEVVEAINAFAGESGGGVAGERVLATMLFTDIVGSTDQAATLGDSRWSAVLDVHDSVAAQVLERHGGELVKTTGDGLLVTFAGPASAIRCAASLRDQLIDLGIEIRSGIHVGEVERRRDDIGGIGVHIAARVIDQAGPGEILVSGAVPPLMAGSGVDFDDRGEHELKGVPGTWQLLAARL